MDNTEFEYFCKNGGCWKAVKNMNAESGCANCWVGPQLSTMKASSNDALRCKLRGALCEPALFMDVTWHKNYQQLSKKVDFIC